MELKQETRNPLQNDDFITRFEFYKRLKRTHWKNPGKLKSKNVYFSKLIKK